MHHKKAFACASAVVLALAVACSKNAETPVSPSSAQPGATEAGPNGETLKASAPTPQSPVNNAQPDQLELTAGKSQGAFDQSRSALYSYEFQIMNSTNAVVCTATVGGGSGPSVSWIPSCTLDFDQPHSWRARAVYQVPGELGAAGPWSAAATFRSPIGGYVRENEIFDPLINGRSAGRPQGVQFISGVGARLNGHDSHIFYEFAQPLQNGEFSLMVTGMDEGSPGDKTKVMAMREGGGDITDNDYRVTIEKRGIDYETPGATTWRIIMGEADEHAGRIFDGPRIPVAYSDEAWYFWRFTWQSPGRAQLQVREGGPRGRVIYDTSRGTGGFLYRPLPHQIFVGTPVGRAGPIDASIPGAIYKNVWVSARPRPAFPGE
jgi:hypothetical protein